MSASVNMQRHEIACELRSFAAEWREGKEPDIMTICYLLFDAFGVIQCSVPLAFETIAAYVDPEGEAVYSSEEIEKFVSEMGAWRGL